MDEAHAHLGLSHSEGLVTAVDDGDVQTTALDEALHALTLACPTLKGSPPLYFSFGA